MVRFLEELLVGDEVDMVAELNNANVDTNKFTKMIYTMGNHAMFIMAIHDRIDINERDAILVYS